MHVLCVAPIGGVASKATVAMLPRCRAGTHMHPCGLRVARFGCISGGGLSCRAHIGQGGIRIMTDSGLGLGACTQTHTAPSCLTPDPCLRAERVLSHARDGLFELSEGRELLEPIWVLTHTLRGYVAGFAGFVLVLRTDPCALICQHNPAHTHMCTHAMGCPSSEAPSCSVCYPGLVVNPAVLHTHPQLAPPHNKKAAIH